MIIFFFEMYLYIILVIICMIICVVQTVILHVYHDTSIFRKLLYTSITKKSNPNYLYTALNMCELILVESTRPSLCEATS
jgi:hypothetical protein